MTSDNSLREGRTGVNVLTFFDRKIPLTSDSGIKNMYLQKKSKRSMEVKSHIRGHLEWIDMGSDVVFHAESKKQNCKPVRPS